jgi:hypothetical protein
LPRPRFRASSEEAAAFAKLYLPDVVGKVEVKFTDGNEQVGSCFLYCQKLYVITCRQILYRSIDNEEVMGSITVAFPKRNIRMTANCVDSDPMTQLAVLQFGPEGETHLLKYPKMSRRETDGSLTFCGGYEGSDFCFSEGVISDLGHLVDFKPSCLVSNLTSPSMRGGLCVGRGYSELIGVIAGNEEEGDTILIPLSNISYFFVHRPSLPQPESHYGHDWSPTLHH